MAKKGLTVDTFELKLAQEKLEEALEDFFQAHNEVITLLDDLVKADWRNTNSRKFARHYKKGEESMNAHLKVMQNAIYLHMTAAVTEYDQLTEDVSAYFAKMVPADEE